MSDQSIFRTFLAEALEERLQEGIRSRPGPGRRAGPKPSSTSPAAAGPRSRTAPCRTSPPASGAAWACASCAPAPRACAPASPPAPTSPGQDFKDLFAQAWQLSALGDEDPWIRQAGPEGVDDLPSRYDRRGDALAPEARIERAMSLEAEARKASARVAAVREATWADGTGASLLLTQKGVRAHDLAASCSASIELAVEQDGDRQAAWHWAMGRHPDAVDLAAIGREAALKGERKLKPVPLTSGRYGVVLHPEVGLDLLGLVAGMLSAEAVLKQP